MSAGNKICYNCQLKADNTQCPKISSGQVITAFTLACDKYVGVSEEGKSNNSILEVGELPEAENTRNKQATLNLSGLSADNFLIKYVNHAAKMTDSYIDYHVGNGLWLLSVVADRKIRVRFAHETIYPNIWTFIIGDSTIARKTASVAIAYDKIAIPVFGTHRFLPQSSSPESLIEELSNAPRSSLVRDEAGGFLRELDKNYMQGMKDTLCTLYDNRDFHRKIRTSQRKSSQTDFNIKNPFLNLLFATTPDIFKSYTNLLDITSGWLVRFLYFTPDHEKEWKGYRKETIEDINLRNEVRHSLELIKLRVDNYLEERDFELSDEAMIFFTEWQKRTETEAMKNKDKNKLRILGRLHTYAVKIAMLLALGDNTDDTSITKTHIEVACRMIDDYFLITACNLLEDISRDEKHNLQDKIIGIIKTYGKVTVRDILRYTHRPKKEIAEALEALDDRGSYEIKTTKSESGKTIYYELNGTKSKKTTAASVTGVMSVTDIQRNNATVVTGENNTTVKRHSNGSGGQSFLCDGSDKRDIVPVGDSSDSQDKPTSYKLTSQDNPIRNSAISRNSKTNILTQSNNINANSANSANPTDSESSQPDFIHQLQTFAKFYQDKHGPINSANKTAFSMEFCKLNQPKYHDGTPVQPSEIALTVSRLFKLIPEVTA